MRRTDLTFSKEVSLLSPLRLRWGVQKKVSPPVSSYDPLELSFFVFAL
ncbi:MAG: hypothetical protein ACD_16C00248G0002 [uncultured bacterium]|nr:MAG: hypothetical protein ACD_16C00248G0002 [uncultured bacterium]